MLLHIILLYNNNFHEFYSLEKILLRNLDFPSKLTPYLIFIRCFP